MKNNGTSGASGQTQSGEPSASGKVEKPDKADNKQAESDRSKSADSPAEAKGDGDRARADRGDGNGGKASSANGNGSKITQISPEKKSKVKSAFSKHHAKAAADVDVNIGIGIVVPRSVKFYPVPEEIIVIAPEYRDYLYFVVGNQVCVVDPETYEIVDIIQIA